MRPAFGADVVAYGLVMVTVVVGVEESVSGGLVSSPVVSDGDVVVEDPEVGFISVVEIRVDVVRDVVDVLREVVVVVVYVFGAYVAGASGRCELSAVSMTAQTNITSSTTAATPET
ncbi:hypothetical protein EV580_5372 [Mycobacterium sp. BK086]|uniref:hypothetical protein n=1 Tax=Mycobacterium sp. BK086 TaxID=2512165 RepID=UPI00105CC567|nr:hypothetical protein [Mycobacterium sp. BK086]TDO07804.1 hypothetical protein EV580_5372 [Mycobacterium sp. BK086]